MYFEGVNQKIIHRDDNDQAFYVFVNLSIEFIWKTSIQVSTQFSMGRNQYWAGRVYDLCVFYMTGTPEGSTESGFMEKPGIEPATPGLQGLNVRQGIFQHNI